MPERPLLDGQSEQRDPTLRLIDSEREIFHPLLLNHRYHLTVDRDLEPGDMALCGHRFSPPRYPPTSDCPDCVRLDQEARTDA